MDELEADHRPPHTVAVVQHPSQPGQCQPSRHVSHVLVLPGSTSSSQVASICSKAPRRSLRTRPADELAYVTGAQAGVPGTECRSLEVLYDADKTSAWSRMLQHDTLRNMTRAILGLLFRSTLGLINIGRCCGLGPGGERVLGGVCPDARAQLCAAPATLHCPRPKHRDRDTVTERLHFVTACASLSKDSTPLSLGTLSARARSIDGCRNCCRYTRRRPSRSFGGPDPGQVSGSEAARLDRGQIAGSKAARQDPRQFAESEVARPDPGPDPGQVS